MAELPGVSDRPPFGVVVVTYGDRWSFLGRVLDTVVSSADVGLVVIVDNGATEDLRAHLAPERAAGRVIVVGADENLGSAGGFALGIETLMAEAPACRHVLLLDDDNVPARGALERVAQAIADVAGERVGFMMNRPSRPEIRALVERGRPVVHVADTYAGFSVRRLFGVLAPTWARSTSTRRSTLEFAPYGGLAIPLAAVREVGLPRRDFFLYGDDHEFTTRLVASGCEIRVLADAELHDLEESWSRGSRTMIAAVDLAQPEERVFYATRNRRYFELRWLKRSSIERWVNRRAYWVAVMADAVILLVRGARGTALRRRISLLRRAIADGERGDLGRVDLTRPPGTDR